MTRSKSDPRIGRIMSVLDAMQRYDAEYEKGHGHRPREGQVDSLLNHSLFRLTFDEWEPQRMRAFLVAACMNAPSEVLDDWAEHAEQNLACCVEADAHDAAIEQAVN